MKIRKLIFCSLAAVLLAAFNSYSHAADYTFNPVLAVSEEFNDNIFLVKEGKQSDFITHIMPSFTLGYQTALWKWDLSYAFDYRFYAENTVSSNAGHALNANGLIEIIKSRLFLNLSDSYQRVSLDPVRDRTQESLFVNQSDQNIITVNPYYELRPASNLTAKTGYIFSNIWYKDTNANKTTDNIVYIDSVYEITKKMQITSGYKFTIENSNTVDLTRHEIYAGPKYLYGENSFVFVNIGNNWTDYKKRNKTSNIYWSAGITHQEGTFIGSLSHSLAFTPNPTGDPLKTSQYSATFTKTLPKGTATLSYNYSQYEDQVTGQSQSTGFGRTKSYGPGGSMKYELNALTTGSLNFSYIRYHYASTGVTTDRYIAGLQIDRQVLKDLHAGLSYNYTYSKANDNTTGDNYKNNRIIADLRKTF